VLSKAPGMDDRLRVRVERVAFVADDVREFVLRPLARSSLRAWRAGAHIRIHARTMDGLRAERRYSIVGRAGDAQCCVIAVHRAHDHGVAAWLHECVVPGDELEISQPVNDFVLSDGAPRTVLIAGGVGITPLLPMAREQLAAGRPFEIHYAARALSAMAYRADVQALGKDKAYLYAGGAGRRLDIAELATRWRADDHLYVCGPRRMIDQVRETAARIGIVAKQVHFESFGAAAAAQDHAFEVELRRSRRTLTVSAGQTILQATAAAGVHAEAECERGECGVCAVRVVEGHVDHRDLCLSPADRQTTKLMTPCVSRALGPRLVLEM
jgi:ferredoxin-NADP reductase